MTSLAAPDLLADAPAAGPAPLPAARQAPPARGLHDSALAQALVWLTRHHGRERSVDALAAGLPLAPTLEPELAVRMLREAGYQATLIDRPLAELHDLLLPAVLLLQDGGAWIVTARRSTAAGDPPRYDIVIPGRVSLQASASAAEIEALHDGRVLVATPVTSMRMFDSSAATSAER